jgi:hypothetical protein
MELTSVRPGGRPARSVPGSLLRPSAAGVAGCHFGMGGGIGRSSAWRAAETRLKLSGDNT